jgi:hypothetical protein
MGISFLANLYHALPKRVLVLLSHDHYYRLERYSTKCRFSEGMLMFTNIMLN